METQTKLSANEIKAGMSNGIWKANFHDGGRYEADISCDLGELPNGIMSIRTVAVCLKNGTIEENSNNPTAIVSAVNNTWLKNINPESVPDLLEALDLVIGSMALERVERFDLLDKCKSAISKATINQ